MRIEKIILVLKIIVLPAISVQFARNSSTSFDNDSKTSSDKGDFAICSSHSIVSNSILSFFNALDKRSLAKICRFNVFAVELKKKKNHNYCTLFI